MNELIQPKENGITALPAKNINVSEEKLISEKSVNDQKNVNDESNDSSSESQEDQDLEDQKFSNIPNSNNYYLHQIQPQQPLQKS